MRQLLQREIRRSAQPAPPPAPTRGVGNHALARLAGGEKAAPEPATVAGDIGDLVEDAKLVLGMAFTALGGNVAIGAPVGRGGKNHRQDVATVCVRLLGAGYPPGSSVGELGDAIARYQADVVRMKHPDGRIDPGGQTIASLRAPKAKPQAPEAAAPKLVVEGADADAQSVAAELQELERRFSALKKNAHNEEVGAGRDELVAGFASLRAKVDKLDPALRPKFYRAMNAISPYYFQGLNIILEFDRVDKKTGKTTHVWNTCNITSLSMALEALGKSAADYRYMHLVPAVAEVFKKDVDERAHDKVGTDLSGLRLPDLVAMAAVIWQMGYKTGDKDAIEKGGLAAFHAVPSPVAVATLARDFGVPARQGELHFQRGDNAASRLSGYGAAHWREASAQADTKKHKDGVFTDASIEHDMPLQQYKQYVMSKLGPELDTGKQIVVGQFNHFVRLQAITDEFVIKDDPGHFLRGDMQLTWEEARAMGLFWNWIAIG